MSNIIRLRSHRSRSEAPSALPWTAIGASSPAPSDALRASARRTLELLIEQFDLAILHARVIEPHIRDWSARRKFAAQIEDTQKLLDLAHREIRRL